MCFQKGSDSFVVFLFYESKKNREARIEEKFHYLFDYRSIAMDYQ
jgi:hypothetical protein